MNTSPRVLIIDDDKEILNLLCDFLQKHNFQIELASNTIEADKKLASDKFDLLVLDIMMPGEDGLSFCKRIRAESSIPVIMLSAVSDDTDRIVGLEIGADDYLPKPFNPRELLARIRAVLRRNAKHPDQQNPIQNLYKNICYQFNEWVLNPAKRELLNSNKVLISLTSSEFDLLLCFVDHPQVVLSRDQLLDLTKGHAAEPFDRSIDVLLSRLRQKVESDSKQPTLIKTIRNSGYIFTATVVSEPCA